MLRAEDLWDRRERRSTYVPRAQRCKERIVSNQQKKLYVEDQPGVANPRQAARLRKGAWHWAGFPVCPAGKQEGQV